MSDPGDTPTNAPEPTAPSLQEEDEQFFGIDGTASTSDSVFWDALTLAELETMSEADLERTRRAWLKYIDQFGGVEDSSGPPEEDNGESLDGQDEASAGPDSIEHPDSIGHKIIR
ncbi:hypothetical protein I350_03838 [Cryptococcus amylolentus CBS 6273]|uniref:Uncharacterized protein n=1 Tax=Cryptococcus amylolentus CBS 6273 TaxID=1296118 RepID=A0A1E3K581_9TREE|nr:hypothetical protein I350_03838 [Cryptococcus amylolentus CBS 6273]